VPAVADRKQIKVGALTYINPASRGRTLIGGVLQRIFGGRARQIKACSARRKKNSDFSQLVLTPGDTQLSASSRQKETSVESTTNQPRIFYGWVILACTFAILCIAFGIQFTYGVFLPFISADTGWDRGNLSLPYSLYVFVYGALSVVSGRLTDRLETRTILAIGAFLLCGGLMLMSQVYALWHIYIALSLVAASGMSAIYVPCDATVVRWFTFKRGLALSITSSGTSFGMFIFPPFVTILILRYGWRATYVILGLLAAIGIFGCAALIVRDPEKVNQRPDGQSSQIPPVSQTSQRITLTENCTFAEAKRTTAFWVISVIFFLTWCVAFIPMVHIVLFADDLGFSHFLAAMTLSIVGLAGVVGRLTNGAISDYLGRISTLSVCLMLQALGFLGFTLSMDLTLLYSAAAVFGFSFGGITVLFPAIIADLFGTAAIGSIIGFIFAFAGSSAALGPFIAGHIYDATGSYRVAFELGAVLNLTALLFVLLVEKPTRLTS
jgi:MFS family permease